MIKRITCLICALLCTVFLPQAAIAGNCYTAEQLEAEQGLRIHSELMVIALNCQAAKSNGSNLYGQYESFTRKHEKLLGSYESTIMSVFRADGIKNPESKLNDFRTSLANRIANEAVRLQTNVFCRAYGPRIQQALNMSEANFRTWAQTVFAGYPLTRPVCTDAKVRTQKAR